jgi:hypothetical protein
LDAPLPRRWKRLSLILAVLAVPVACFAYSWLTFPSDKTPKGAYLRVAQAVNQADPSAFFAYTEEAAQHACFSIRDYRRRSLSLVGAAFPPDERAALQARYGAFARAPDGADVFALLALQHGWVDQLRKDMSGVERVEEVGPRATIQTVKGTRYAFRKRPGGIWGMTAFTPALVAEAEKAARDFKQLEKVAADYERVGSSH